MNFQNGRVVGLPSPLPHFKFKSIWISPIKVAHSTFIYNRSSLYSSCLCTTVGFTEAPSVRCCEAPSSDK